MTREKAIDLLDNLIGMVEDNNNSDYDTALKMAIKTLKRERNEMVLIFFVVVSLLIYLYICDLIERWFKWHD